MTVGESITIIASLLLIGAVAAFWGVERVKQARKKKQI